MSDTKLEHHYRCWDDCRPQGCPGHTAILQYQSVSNSLHFSDGKGNGMYMQTPELKAFLTMIRTLSKSRVEIDSVLKEVSEQHEQEDKAES